MAQKRVAWVLLFLLASHQVHAVRDAVDFGASEARVASVNSRAKELAERLEAVKAHSEFRIELTHWATGKEKKLKWKETQITFKAVKEGDLECIEMHTQDLKKKDVRYRIMPDAAVVAKKLKGMPVMAIFGYQLFDSKKSVWKGPTYAKDDGIYIRAETNKHVGWTTDDWANWRYAGYKLYKPQNAKMRPYYIDKDGNFYTVKDKDVDKGEDPKNFKEKVEPFSVQAGDTNSVWHPLRKPDTDLTALVDGLLGHSSCLNNPSTCAFRCFYNVEADTCGPRAFCQPWEDWDAVDGVSRLAPFQEKQKCRALGSEDGHEEADEVLLIGLKKLKKQALHLSSQLNEAESVASDKAGKTSIKQSLALWQEANDLLSVFEALPARLGEQGGNFSKASEFVQKEDMKHWRGLPPSQRLDKKGYETAAKQDLATLGIKNKFSVPAKLHSELVEFMIKRPTVVIHGVKQESGDKCVLSEKDHFTLETFVKYYLGVPGYNPSDLSAGTAQLPQECQEYLMKMGTSDDVAKTDEAATALMKGEKMEEEDAKEAGVENLVSKDAASGLVQLADSASFGSMDDTQGLGESGFTPDPSGGLLEMSEQVLPLIAFIVICVLICLFCVCISGFFFKSALWVMNNTDNVVLFVILMALGGAVVAGAWCMAWPMGVVTLVAGLATGVWMYHDAKNNPGRMFAELGGANAKRQGSLRELGELFSSAALTVAA